MHPVRNPSLTFRITAMSLATILWLVIIAGGAILWAYNRSIERSIDNTLGAYIDVLVASTSVNKRGNVVISDDVAMLQKIPRYWQIAMEEDGEFKLLKKSPLLKEWIKPPFAKSRVSFTDSDGTQVLAFQRTVMFPGKKPVNYLFGMQEEIADVLIEAERAAFSRVLIPVLGLIAAALTLLAFLQIRATVSPFARIRRSLEAVRSGKETRLASNFPREIQPLATEVNALLHYIAESIERHRVFASNLSHALKTPLAVLQNEAQKESGKLAEAVIEKSEVMQLMIDRNLARVKAAATANIIGARMEVAETLQKIARSFGKLHRKNVQVSCADDILFRGDEGDFYEMVGNLVENACKYAAEQVTIHVGEAESNLILTIEDDGPGIPESQHMSVLTRGTRLDENTPGTGIGLSISHEIIRLYNGTLNFSHSSLGGLKVTITLPSAAI